VIFIHPEDFNSKVGTSLEGGWELVHTDENLGILQFMKAS
jgi:hypothetical protein